MNCGYKELSESVTYPIYAQCGSNLTRANALEIPGNQPSVPETSSVYDGRLHYGILLEQPPRNIVSVKWVHMVCNKISVCYTCLNRLQFHRAHLASLQCHYSILVNSRIHSILHTQTQPSAPKWWKCNLFDQATQYQFFMVYWWSVVTDAIVPT